MTAKVSHYITVRKVQRPVGQRHYAPLVQCKELKTGNVFTERFCFLPELCGYRLPEIVGAIRFVTSNGASDPFAK